MHCEISRYLDRRRYDECRAGHTEDHSRDKSRCEGIFPDAENAQRPVNPDRYKRKKQPDPRDRLDLLNSPPKGIYRIPEQQPEVNAKAPRTNAKLLALDMKRPARYLMANIAVKSIQRRRDRCKAVCLSQRSNDNKQSPGHRHQAANEPHAKGLCPQSGMERNRYVRASLFVHK